jgi:aspartyl-tRNA(Asn)/glutamyl-tRNA(Gln) amidotransferase subunit A
VAVPAALADLSLREAAARIRSGEVTAVALVGAVLARLDERDERLGAVLARGDEGALVAAEAVDRNLTAGGDVGPLAGVPIGLKDNICTRDLPTTAGSRMLEHFQPAYDATVVERLRAAGAIPVAKLNCDEFAMGSSTENSAFRPTRNPWDLSRVPGGSSGGSAAAVAAGLCAGALGTDTGGSIRLPASFCGVVGVKPSYGRVSRYGVIAYASSLDQVGPVTRDVADAALLLGVIAGHDPRDSTSSPRPTPDFAAALGDGVRGLRIGLPREYFVEGMQPEVETAVRGAVDRLRELGATVTPVTLPHTPYAIATYYLVATAEASSNLARYDGVRYGRRAESNGSVEEMYRTSRGEGFGTEVKRRIMLGTYVLSAGYYDAYYVKAQRARTAIASDFRRAFETCDVLAAPVAPTTAFRLGERLDDPVTMYLSDVLTISANLAGIPALSVPCGRDAAGLPVGLQLLGRPFDEATLLRVAAAHEATGDWPERRPPA